MIFFLLFAVPGVALALAGERAGRRKIILLGKGVASAGFLVMAWSLMPDAPTPYAWWVLGDRLTTISRI
ncbi:MAG: hypothetical protein EHM23_27890 [Acidobacteria bacterium]|nr:MAG: hypothetical protein EHM23_27890 [Acidobacteriota bacterium]